MGRFSKGYRDFFAVKAKIEGYRARSAYKLTEVIDKFNLLEDVTAVVDLCAAPGSWSQVLARRLSDHPSAMVVAVDLQKIGQLRGVTVVTGDICSTATHSDIISALGGRSVKLVTCDGAPDMTGCRAIDQELQLELVLAALRTAVKLLAPGGRFVSKFFHGSCSLALSEALSLFFEHVSLIKPEASRPQSTEIFIVGLNFQKNVAVSDEALADGCKFKQLVQNSIVFRSAYL
uniref:tRNA (Cytidine(32)/guanosine(34)-2'-O)-methyltransferase n=1 Tax=Dermatophagoides pteronyssinus TaxID=6956 RepID=A0A6P6YJP5_DERPT|nr:putative tRNA (cytidine(32)/guanosine(34)-2'-O)-methyltransferase [Dermatophagoides pteronyssinus]